jgi:hypothetical protein
LSAKQKALALWSLHSKDGSLTNYMGALHCVSGVVGAIEKIKKGKEEGIVLVLTFKLRMGW